jgi:hypothetical protein
MPRKSAAALATLMPWEPKPPPKPPKELTAEQAAISWPVARPNTSTARAKRS